MQKRCKCWSCWSFSKKAPKEILKKSQNKCKKKAHFVYRPSLSIKGTIKYTNF